jgi:hypothetical protein
MTEREGGCQCGRVRYRTTAEPLFLAACHCKECQRASGSAFGLSLIMPQDGVVIEGELKMFERSSDSGRPLKCFFCPECGTRIYHQPSHAPVINMRAGTLDDTSWLQPQLHAWTSAKQPWLTLPDGVKTHPTQP